jgi:uncharacterized protein with PIN domain
VTARIEAGFRHRFRELLALVSPRRLEFGVELLMGRGRDLAVREGLPLATGLAQVYEFTRVRVKRRVEVTGACAVVRPPWARFSEARPPRFLCDPSLGGLARWLRAAGYEAGEARGPEAPLAVPADPGLVLLTTDSALLDRLPVREGHGLVLWLPSALTMREQLAIVLRDLGLRPREARCMACGGALVQARKEDVHPRIPPRTALWKDEYFVCAGCDRLFWQGTHWERIAHALAAAAGP